MSFLTIALLIIVGLLAVPLIFIMYAAKDDPGYGAEYMGLNLFGGALLFLIAVVLIILAFTDIKIFLILLGVFVATGFLSDLIREALNPTSERDDPKTLDAEKAEVNFHKNIDWGDRIYDIRLEIDSYYLADEGVIRLYYKGWRQTEDKIEIERPATSEAEAKTIFDFYLFKLILEANKAKDEQGPEVDDESYSVEFQIDPTFFGQWFPLKGFIRLEAETREAREWPAKTLYEADTVFQAYAWELGTTANVESVLLQLWLCTDESKLFGLGPNMEEERQSWRLTDLIKAPAGKDGSISFDGGGGYTGIYSGNVIKLSAPPDIEKTVTVKNPMEAILVFKDFSLSQK